MVTRIPTSRDAPDGPPANSRPINRVKPEPHCRRGGSEENSAALTVEFRTFGGQLQFIEDVGGECDLTSVFAPAAPGELLPAVHFRHIAIAPADVAILQFAGPVNQRSSSPRGRGRCQFCGAGPPAPGFPPPSASPHPARGIGLACRGRGQRHVRQIEGGAIGDIDGGFRHSDIGAGAMITCEPQALAGA